MKNKRIVSKLIALFGISMFFLNACATKTEPADVVITKFKQAVKTIDAVDMKLEASMTGKDEKDNINFDLTGDVKLDRLSDVKKADVTAKLGGSLLAADKKMEGNIDLEILTIGQEFYFFLNQFDTSDPQTENIEKQLEPYIKKWEHLASDFVPESIKKWQEKDEAALKREEQLKDLFVNTTLFDVTKEYGIEKVEGNKAYHYAVRPNKEGVKEYIKKAATINGREMTDQEVLDSASFVDSITNLELWIGHDDYFLYKGVLELSGKNPDSNVTSQISITYTGNSYNKDLKLKAPDKFEEFNPISLIMSMQLEEGATTGTAEEGATPTDENATPTTETPAPETETPVTPAPVK